MGFKPIRTELLQHLSHPVLPQKLPALHHPINSYGEIDLAVAEGQALQF